MIEFKFNAGDKVYVDVSGIHDAKPRYVRAKIIAQLDRDVSPNQADYSLHCFRQDSPGMLFRLAQQNQLSPRYTMRKKVV